MTTLEKIRAEIQKRYDDCEEDWETGEQYGYWNCLKIIDKYAEQEKDAYDNVLAYLKANVDDFPDYHEAIEAVLKMKGGE